MSVASPVIDYIDPVARKIYLVTGVSEYHPIDDIYHEVRNLRRTDESLRGFFIFVQAGGNIPKNAAGTVRTPRYAIFRNCQVVLSTDTYVSGEQLYADAADDIVGKGPDAVDHDLSPADAYVDYEPPGSEVFYVDSGSGVTPSDVEDIADAVWDEVLTGATHNIPTSSGRRLRQLGDVVSGLVSDVSPTTTGFDTNLAGYPDTHFDDQLVYFVDGNLAGLVRPILSFTGANGHIEVAEVLYAVPDNGSAFDIIPAHVHPVSQIAAGVWDEQLSSPVTGSYGEAISDIETAISEIQATTIDLLGLGGENVKWTNMAHDANNLLTSATITHYTDETLTVVSAVWQLTAAYDAQGRLTSHQMVVVP